MGANVQIIRYEKELFMRICNTVFAGRAHPPFQITVSEWCRCLISLGNKNNTSGRIQFLCVGIVNNAILF